MVDFKQRIPQDFHSPTHLPRDESQRDRWQDANRTWWESNPMRYDFSDEIHEEQWSRAYFEEIDRRFFQSAAEFMPPARTPFDAVIDFPGLKRKDVLEIGVGSGTHAQLLATAAGSFTGIDLTEHAISATKARMECFGLDGRLERMDAERMSFPDESFDYVWSWGVIHHSANTDQIISEITRVLRPGGEACVMVYHRSFLVYYVLAGLFHGLLRGEIFRMGSLDRALQSLTDGAIARFYTQDEWRALIGPRLSIEEVCVFGQKADLLPLPAGRLKNELRRRIPNEVSRFITNTCRQGVFLYTRMRKPR
jgi:2-polyprenyl-3-methyl-5-hydroxy-6-metoxy-1,4-benzoquinol methylase